MRNELLLLLLGASFFLPGDLDAQRGRDRDRDDRATQRSRVQRLEPIRAPGRVQPRRAVRPRTVVDRRHRVVYSPRPRYGVRGRTHLWVRANWGPMRLRIERPYRPYRAGYVLDRRDLKDLLGKRTVNRLKDAGRDAGLRGALEGHWVAGAGRANVLVITMGRADLAELVDTNADGFIDEIFFVRDRRGVYPR